MAGYRISTSHLISIQRAISEVAYAARALTGVSKIEADYVIRSLERIEDRIGAAVYPNRKPVKIVAKTDVTDTKTGRKSVSNGAKIEKITFQKRLIDKF